MTIVSMSVLRRKNKKSDSLTAQKRVRATAKYMFPRFPARAHTVSGAPCSTMGLLMAS